jgi:hexosaminidase
MLRTDTTKSLPCLTITDEPAFSYRGMHLDVSRHFFEPAVIKKYLDVMAKLKLNQFHWHLTDDQGWRIEIKKYPKLTETGAVRTEKNGSTHGGFYTQEQIREIVQYAKERYITVIPEIDFPGHASAIIASYPELGCYGQQIQVPNTFGIKEDILCPSDSVIQFLKDVMDEVCVLFPGKYIHIGGDEVQAKHWNESPAARSFSAEKNIPVKKMHAYFIEQIAAHLAAKGKKSIGWGEILDSELTKDITVMSWRGTEAGIKAANQGNDVIMTPRQLTYFDYHQDWDEEKKAIYMIYLPLNKVYGFDPYSKVKSAEAKKHVIGGQACLWTEFVETEDKLFYQLYPRVTALAECLWTKKSDKNYGNYSKRLKALKHYFVKERELPPIDMVRIKPKKEKK